MDWQNEMIKKQYILGPSSGTTPVTKVVIEEDDRFIAAETIITLTSRLLPLRSEVIDSLDQSIRKNADIWSELSKY